MVMLVPFTTALPPQNNFSDYATRTAESDRTFRTDETADSGAEKPRDTSPDRDDEPNEEDFSRVLGVLLNVAGPLAKPEPTTTEAVKDATVAEVASAELPAADSSGSLKNILSPQPGSQTPDTNRQGKLPQGQIERLHLHKVSVADINSTLKPLAESARTANEAIDVSRIGTAAGPDQTRTIPVLSALVTPANDLSKTNLGEVGVNELKATQQLNQGLKPEMQIGFQQFAAKTTFTSALKPYEIIKDSDAVTQEIMNALSRAIATSAPERLPHRIVEPSSGMPSVDIQMVTNSVLPFSDEISSISSTGNSVRNAAELPREDAGLQVPVTAAPHDQPTGGQRGKELSSGLDRGPRQTFSRHRDLLQPAGAPVQTSANDASRLSTTGSVSQTLPDLTTSVSAEMRQPLSSQVSRAVMEHLERQSSAESETLTVQLDPPDLGEMVIELSKSKEGLSVKVTAREAVTMDMLLARGSEIESQLRGEKMDLRSLEFLSPQMMNGGASQQQSSRDSSSLFEQSPATSRRNSRSDAATQITSASPKRTGESQHALNFRA